MACRVNGKLSKSSSCPYKSLREESELHSDDDDVVVEDEISLLIIRLILFNSCSTFCVVGCDRTGKFSECIYGKWGLGLGLLFFH
ncbi:hypothetical protein F8388_007713 [Cannabis sativa]|uniref:Carbohydrate-binding module family 19 domain-containing protein n=1 Tax=Cannabis sativa TaxID=3483 RepID=A0A7J6FT92_CANSA|nr:hypothetical protein F8388_007713 [Cannabis sativa]